MTHGQRQERKGFEKWRNRTKKRLPEIAIKFYSKSYHDYEKHVLLGRVIEKLNNPYYAITNDKGDFLDPIEVTSSIIILEILTEQLFKYVYTEI